MTNLSFIYIKDYFTCDCKTLIQEKNIFRTIYFNQICMALNRQNPNTKPRTKSRLHLLNRDNLKNHPYFLTYSVKLTAGVMCLSNQDN